MDPLIGQLLGDYLVKSPLGEGAFAQVYLAEQQSLRRPAVLKILREGLYEDPRFVERFQKEATLAARLSHPGVAAIFATGKTPEGRPFFAMEYVPGQTLTRLLAAGALEPRRAARLLCLVAEAVDAAHEQ